jgi:hypothetical protein
MELNASLMAVMVMSLEQFPNDELAAMNNALSMGPRLPSHNLAFRRAKDASLVDADGGVSGLEELREAMSYEIIRRVDAGTFN